MCFTATCSASLQHWSLQIFHLRKVPESPVSHLSPNPIYSSHCHRFQPCLIHLSSPHPHTGSPLSARDHISQPLPYDTLPSPLRLTWNLALSWRHCFFSNPLRWMLFSSQSCVPQGQEEGKPISLSPQCHSKPLPSTALPVPPTKPQFLGSFTLWT